MSTEPEAPCNTAGCAARVAFTVHWPSSRGPIVCCWDCTARWLEVAGAMGFNLPIYATAYGAELLNEVGAAMLARQRLRAEAGT